MEKKILDMKDISKTFGSVQALKGLEIHGKKNCI